MIDGINTCSAGVVQTSARVWTDKNNKIEGFEMEQTLEQRVSLAKTDELELERLLKQFRPLMLSTILKYRKPDDESIQIAAMAFVESIFSYDGSKGSFLALTRVVIQRRLIDYIRKESGVKASVALDEDEDRKKQIMSLVSRQKYEIDREQEERKEEINRLEAELDRWGITMQALGEASPKHKNTKNICRRAITAILSHFPWLEQMLKKMKVPLKEISLAERLNYRQLENHRRYIVAGVVVHNGDYLYLKEYIPLTVQEEGGDY